MIILGLTGGIGMGKSTATAMLRRLRVPVFDADAAVHRLQARGGRAVAPIGAAFPGSVVDGRVDREALRRAVLGHPAALSRLERIVWPLVRAEERRFLHAARRRAERMVVLDVPLLFENGGERRVHQVIVVSAPAAVQRARVLRRLGMTADRFDSIRARQMPDAQKRRRADHVILTGISRHFAQAGLRRIVRGLRSACRHPGKGRWSRRARGF